MNFLKGKKTIISMCLFAVLAVISLFPSITIPEGVFAMLGALGFGFLRAGITKLSDNAGWKTYGAVVAAIGIGFLQTLSIELPISFEAIYGLLGTFGIVGVRDALKKISNPST